MERIKQWLSPDNLSFGLVVGLTFLLPIFFLTMPGISLDVGKAFLVSIVTVLAIALWFVGRLIDGVVRIPKSLIIAGCFLIALSFLFSAIASPVMKVSMFGQGFEVGTFAFILIGALLALVTSLSINSRNRVFQVYTAILASFAVLAIYHIIRLFAGAGTLSFGIFTDQLSNTVGKWNDLATFFGLTAVFSVITLELLSLKGLIKGVLYLALALSLFMLAVVNFTFAWIILAVVSVVVFVYAIYLNKFDTGTPVTIETQSKMPKVPAVALVTLLVALFFAFTANTVGGSLSTRFKTTQVEVRPSWSATYDIMKGTLMKSPIFGSGPNRFANQWSLNKPDVLNSTIFWSTDFNASIGLIPTFVVTTGLIGILAWLFFFGTFLYKGARAVLSFGSGRVSQYLILSSFLSSLYLWLFTIFYVPNVVVTSFAFLMTGVFVSVLVIENMTGKFELSLMGNPKVGFVSVLVLILLIVSCAGFGYLFVEKTLSVVDFQKAITAVNTKGDLDTAESLLGKAITLNPTDVYYRGLSQLAVARLNNILQDKTLSQDALKTQFTNYMGNAIDSAKQAINYDGTNYVNWLNLGGVYEAVVPLNVSGAYEEALKSYQQAAVVSPKNPQIYYTMARLEVAKKNFNGARDDLNKALTMKSNYTEALFFLSQIEANQGNLQEAITRADQASQLAPNDVGLFFQLGLLKYTAKDYEGAISALERATSLTPDYANAMYFLGLSYNKVGRNEESLKLFKRINELNPDNKEVQNIITNIEAGRDAFTNVAPPNNTPEKKKTLPVKEKKPAVAPTPDEL